MADSIYSVFQISAQGRPEDGPYHSAEGFFGLAESYLKTANLVAAQGQAFSVPALANLGQAFELLLKSYLLAVGAPEWKLPQQHLGHNLDACLTEAERFGLKVDMSTVEREQLTRFSTLYMDKELHYFYEYAKSLPDFMILAALTMRIQQSVFNQLSKPYFGATAAGGR